MHCNRKVIALPYSALAQVTFTCSKSTLKLLIRDVVQVFLLLNLKIFHTFLSVSIVDFKQKIVSWESDGIYSPKYFNLFISISRSSQHLILWFENFYILAVFNFTAFWFQPFSGYLIHDFDPACIYLLKFNNRNTRTVLSIQIPERRHWHRSGIFIVNFEHIAHLVLEFLLLTLNI